MNMSLTRARVLVFTVNAVTIYVFILSFRFEVNPMANVLETVGNKLVSGEQVLHQYRVICQGNDGFLVLSSKKIRFLEQKGIFQPRYQISIEIPYEQVKDIYVCACHQLTLQTRKKQYCFVSLGYISADIIAGEVNNIKKQLAG